jgi:hypothetical protein
MRFVADRRSLPNWPPGGQTALSCATPRNIAAQKPHVFRLRFGFDSPPRHSRSHALGSLVAGHARASPRANVPLSATLAAAPTLGRRFAGSLRGLRRPLPASLGEECRSAMKDPRDPGRASRSVGGSRRASTSAPSAPTSSTPRTTCAVTRCSVMALRRVPAEPRRKDILPPECDRHS